MDKRTWLNQFIIASLWASGTSYFFFAFNFLGQIVLARLLMPADFGIYAFTLACRELTLVLLGFATNQIYIQSEGEQQDFNATYFIYIMASLLIVLVGIIGSVILFYIYNEKYAVMFFVICVAQVMTFLGTAHLAPHEKALRYKQVSLIQGGSSSGAVIVAIFAAWLNMGLWSLAIREVVQGLLTWVMGSWLAGQRAKWQIGVRAVKQQFNFGMRTAISRGLEIIYYRFPEVLIQVLLGKIALAYFFQARYLAYLPIKLTTPFSEQVLFSYMHELKDDKRKLEAHLYWVNYTIMRLLLPFVLIILFFGPQLFLWIYGSRWEVAGEYFRYFSFFVLFAALFSSLKNVCYSLGKQKIVTQAYLIALAVFIVFIATLAVGKYSALAFSIGAIVTYFYLLFRLWNFDIRMPLRRLFLNPLILLVVTVGMYKMVDSLGVFLGILILLLILFYGLEYKELTILTQRLLKR